MSSFVYEMMRLSGSKAEFQSHRVPKSHGHTDRIGENHRVPKPNKKAFIQEREEREKRKSRIE